MKKLFFQTNVSKNKCNDDYVIYQLIPLIETLTEKFVTII